MLVAKHHPLSRLPLSEALPFLKVFTCCCKQVNQSREDEYASLLEDLQKNPTDSTVIVDKKPEDGGEEEEDDDVKFDWRALKHFVKEEDSVDSAAFFFVFNGQLSCSFNFSARSLSNTFREMSSSSVAAPLHDLKGTP